MTHFRADNTEGYSAEQLAELNRRYEAAIAEHSPADRAEKSVVDAVAESVLAEFDAADITPIDISEINESLLADINGSTSGWALYEAPYKDATVSNQRYQVVFNPESGRAGIVFCGSGSSGATEWTDATSAEDAMRRFHDGEMAN